MGKRHVPARAARLPGLNTIIDVARAMCGHSNAPAGYSDLYAAALQAKREKRAMFPLSGEHRWDVLK